MCSISTSDIQICKAYAEEPDPPASLLFLQAANELMTTHGLQFPVTIEDAVCLYTELVTLIESQM